MKQILLCGAMLLAFAACGSKPPTEDLNQAKAALAKAEEAKAQEFAAAEYQSANTSLNEGEQLIVPKKNKKNDQAKKKLDASKLASEAAYKKSAPAYADFNLAEADKARTEAQAVKAGVAVKDRFSEAEALLAEARTEREAGRYESSWDRSIKAKTIFKDAAAEAVKKRTRAEEAIRGADSSIRDAEQQAGEE
jgi:hypothetical protein